MAKAKEDSWLKRLGNYVTGQGVKLPDNYSAAELADAVEAHTANAEEEEEAEEEVEVSTDAKKVTTKKVESGKKPTAKKAKVDTTSAAEGADDDEDEEETEEESVSVEELSVIVQSMQKQITNLNTKLVASTKLVNELTTKVTENADNINAQGKILVNIVTGESKVSLSGKDANLNVETSAEKNKEGEPTPIKVSIDDIANFSGGSVLENFLN